MVIRFRNFRARFYYIGMVMRTAAFLALFWAAMALPALAEIGNNNGGKVRQAKAPAPRESKVNPADGQRYVWIPPGTFRMGCSPGDNECYGDEKPAHTVTISRGFWMGQTEVTVGARTRDSRAAAEARCRPEMAVTTNRSST
jgi:formylglycine-generating enzyme required for sulfatase activity